MVLARGTRFLKPAAATVERRRYGLQILHVHPVRAPDGVVFDTDDISQEQLKKQGWVDTAHKFGYRSNGQSDPATFVRVKAEYEAAQAAQAISEDPVCAELQAKLERLKKELAERETRRESLRAELASLKGANVDLAAGDWPAQRKGSRALDRVLAIHHHFETTIADRTCSSDDRNNSR